ncbi:MAG TPA: caspase family protein [Polyangiaceae bacterium]|nr:caspase family protein [Polyangiaceae bacterium]
MKRLWLSAGLAALTSCASSSPHLVSKAQTRNVRVYVHDPPILSSSDDDCRPFYPVLQKSLPYAVRHGLADSGFTVVKSPAEVHDAEAVINGNLNFCRKAGTCVNGSAEVTIVSNGLVVERHRYDTGGGLCASAPTVDEFPHVFVDGLEDRLLGSQPVAQLARDVSVIKADFEAGRIKPAAPAAAAGTTTAASPGTPAAYVQGAPQPNAFALIVGIEKYRDVPPPTGARADAQAFARLAERTLGVPEDHVRLLIDEHATRGDLEKALAWLELNVPAGGRVYFFYSGHGAPDPVSGTAYVLPYDGDPAALDQTALLLSAVTERLARTKAAESVAFLDACFSGTGGRSVLPKGARPLVRVQAPVIARGVAVLASSSGSEISGATADGQNGLFSKYLLEALGGALADADNDLQISMGELLSFIEPRVARDARLENRVQTPNVTVPDGRPPGTVFVAFGVKR